MGSKVGLCENVDEETSMPPPHTGKPKARQVASIEMDSPRTEFF